jgi:hypothetical protein
MDELLESMFQQVLEIRYVAVYVAGQLTMRERPDLAHASASESDRYEELLVNPTLLTLAQQRGNIDCGGMRYLIIRYGFFFQLVIPLKQGHISIAFESHANPLAYVERITQILRDHALA